MTNRGAGVFWICALGLALAISGCVGKSMTKSRSQVISEAKSQGIRLPSIEEEKALFYEQEEIQKKRLLALLKSRAGGDLRDASYRIGAGDNIELNVFDVAELNLTTPVNQAGLIALPLIGAVRAQGLTEAELAVELRRRLSTYVKNPEVVVTVSKYGSQRVAVLGAVRKPGNYALSKGANSLLELISRAGGVTEKAGNLVDFIPAEFSGLGGEGDVETRAQLAMGSFDEPILEKSSVQLYLDNVLGTGGGIPLEIPVRGGDMVIVPDAGSVTVDGEVEKRGSYTLGSQMTLLNALAAAGGITYGADVNEVEVIRDIGTADRKARLVVNLEKIAMGEDRDVRLKNGDIIRVPSNSGRRLRQDTFESITKILNFGVGGSVPLN
ncbi:MAG: polysaccharide export protein [Deltaproteobacteria bacterium]|nr:polysaccharide export protein [Deltaproteobacteria bacterium]